MSGLPATPLLDKLFDPPTLLRLLQSCGYDTSLTHHACYKDFSYLKFSEALLKAAQRATERSAQQGGQSIATTSPSSEGHAAGPAVAARPQDEGQEVSYYGVASMPRDELVERVIELEDELARLKRGEFICRGCGIRKNAEVSDTPPSVDERQRAMEPGMVSVREVDVKAAIRAYNESDLAELCKALDRLGGTVRALSSAPKAR